MDSCCIFKRTTRDSKKNRWNWNRYTTR